MQRINNLTRRIVRALSRSRNLGTLIVLAGLSMLFYEQLNAAMQMAGVAYEAIWPVIVAIYLVMSFQTLAGRKFQKEFIAEEKIRKLKEMNAESNMLYNNVVRNTNQFYKKKLQTVSDDKDDLVKLCLEDKNNPIKEKIAGQGLELSVAYMKLLNNFCTRSRKLADTDLGTVAERINDAYRRINFEKDQIIGAEIRKVIESDERLLDRIKTEKRELERIAARLDYVQSTVSSLRHSALTDSGNGDLLESIDDIVNEAEALDNVLEDRRKERKKN